MTRDPAAGFTLIELTVVLAIMGLMLALMPSALSVAIPGQRLRAAAHRLADNFRDARSRAVMSGGTTSVPVRLDGETRLPRGTTILVEDVPTASIVDGLEEMRFFPDGSASGGKVTLAAGGRTYAITVDWLTGRVAVDD